MFKVTENFLWVVVKNLPRLHLIMFYRTSHIDVKIFLFRFFEAKTVSRNFKIERSLVGDVERRNLTLF